MFARLTPARKAIASLFGLFSLFAVAACDPVALGTSPSGGPSIDTSAAVPVALLVPRGSGNGGDDALAQSLENAARLAIADLGDVKIDLRVYSTAGNAAQAQNAAVQAVNEGAKIILGPVYAESANAVGVAVAPRGINVLSFSNNTTIAGGNVFVLGPTFQNTANRLASFAARQGKKRVLIVHSTDLAGQLGSRAIQNAVTNSGGTVAGVVGHELSQNGVIAAVPQIRNAAQSGQADAIFMTANTAGALPILSQLLPEAGLTSANVQYIGLTRWDIPSSAPALPGLQGGWFALPDPNMSQRFDSRYSAAFGAAPHPIGGLAYDGIAAIGALVKAGKSDALTASALTQGAGFQGVNGIFRLNRNGVNERGLAVAQIRDQKVVVIDGAPRAFGGAGF
jgi:ABC-type branched-subunit amino acid transport system substrate-binding protein